MLDQDFVPNSDSEDSEVSIVSPENEFPEQLSNIQTTKVSCFESTAEIQESVIGKDSLPIVPVCTTQLEISCRKAKQVQVSEVHSKVSVGNTENTVEDITGTTEDPSIQSSNISSSVSKKNYCYICGKPQSKYARHLKTHEKSNVDVARALALPKHSKERQKLLNKLRNKGNYQHNADVLANGTGLLKLVNQRKYIIQKIMCIVCIAMQCFSGGISGDTFVIVFPNQWKIRQCQEELGSCLWQQCVIHLSFNKYHRVFGSC